MNVVCCNDSNSGVLSIGEVGEQKDYQISTQLFHVINNR